jgi:molybdopterin molybdotransferase
MLSYEQAREKIQEKVGEKKGPRPTEQVPLGDALGYVLAQEVKTDREYPPFDRATRDGYAVFASDAKAGAKLQLTGEIKAGDHVTQELLAGTCVQIMTGAAVPPGANAVVMIEHTRREGDGVRFERDTVTGQNIVPQGSEATAGQTVLTPGVRLGYAELALAGQVGAAELRCGAKPRVAILSTGDEIVPVESAPGRFQIRNSNSVSLAAQVRLAGGQPILLGNAQDREDDLSPKIKRGLQEDLLILSGGVSMGKYDLVEKVLREMGAEFFFDAVAIRPGKPAVFGTCNEKFVFGLPGNPVSTMVTFELFVVPALDLLSGMEARPLPVVEARLAESLHERPGLRHFLPARVQGRGAEMEVRALRWQGSGDVAALGKANGFVIVPPHRAAVEAGERVEVLMRRELL